MLIDPQDSEFLYEFADFFSKGVVFGENAVIGEININFDNVQDPLGAMFASILDSLDSIRI